MKWRLCCVLLIGILFADKKNDISDQVDDPTAHAKFDTGTSFKIFRYALSTAGMSTTTTGQESSTC